MGAYPAVAAGHVPTREDAMELGYRTTLQTTFDDAVARTREALGEVGFGVLTEIDVTATLKKKLDEDMENYLILGACNPQFAHRALGVDRQIGLLLPCNVVVRDDPEHEGSVIVEAMNPDVMVAVTDAPGLPEVAAGAGELLRNAIGSLTVK
ncbi:Uncharacterized conserved protein [Gordonia paraffinivorans]|uniref:Uncharacterized conserved protein n=2 Tax=Gordonia paraffinivorans TaxID=175628 RepID=A0ABD7V5L6_9ACTN|nr:Uncharacterized conserved protein [Gordonia paraffinivorans]